MIQRLQAASIKMAHVPEDKVDVEEDFSPKGITPAAQEKGANDREQMINNALVHLSHSILEINVLN
jgi:hypothetical protein